MQEEIYERFLDLLRKKAEACAVGMVSALLMGTTSLADRIQPEDETTSFGPLVSLENSSAQLLMNIVQISKLQQEKVLAYIESGRQMGATVLTGGSTWSGSPNGYYVQPTVLTGTTQDMKVVQEEVTCPISVTAQYSPKVVDFRSRDCCCSVLGRSRSHYFSQFDRLWARSRGIHL